MINQPQDILDFWEEAGPKKWFAKDAEFDATIATRFKDTHELAAQGGYDDWADDPDGALALIIVLDQFSRNLFRKSPAAFTQDEKCLRVTHKVIDEGLDKKMREDLRVFAYMPLMHSERLEDQELCIEKLQEIGADENINYAKEHRDIIAKFGRFPHRNVALGRDTTEEEREFLDEGGFAG